MRILEISEGSIKFIEKSQSGVFTIKNQKHIEELNLLKDEESVWRKFQRWLIGIKWKALLLK